MKKNVPLAQFLIDMRANVNHQTRVHSTPLIAAAKEGDLTLAKLLVENGANVNAVTLVSLYTLILIFIYL